MSKIRKKKKSKGPLSALLVSEESTWKSKITAIVSDRGDVFCKFWKMCVLNVYFSAEMLMQLVLWTFVCFLSW